MAPLAIAVHGITDRSAQDAPEERDTRHPGVRAVGTRREFGGGQAEAGALDPARQRVL